MLMYMSACMLIKHILLQVFKGGHKILKMQRYQFPPKWLELEMIEGEWSAFNEILKRKDAAIQSQVAPLSHKIVQESKLVEQKTTDLLNDWEKGRPVQVMKCNSGNCLIEIYSCCLG